MLEFLKENLKSGKNQPAENDVVKNLSSDDFLEPAVQTKTMKQSSSLLIVMLAIGALCLFVMIKKSTVKTAIASQDDLMFEQTMAQFSGNSSNGIDQVDKIVNRFYKLSEIKQVDPENLNKNPFKYESLAAAKIHESLGSSGLESSVGSEYLIRQELEKKVKEMQLISIMQSSEGNCCMIDDKILYKGNMIEDFKVSDISEEAVTLTADGMNYILSLTSD